ncbi:MAG TPA: PIN domain-containing protein [Longimicrobium sp.]|jgi:predicted nucleic acid-binding protein
MIRIYLDTCCLNRPFDDQTQDRVRAEAEAIVRIIEKVYGGDLELIRSEVVEAEAAAIPDPQRRRQVLALSGTGTVEVRTREEHLERAGVLKMLGFGEADALHIACAEFAGADALLTTDDAMIRRAQRLPYEMRIRVVNPLTWLKELGS